MPILLADISTTKKVFYNLTVIYAWVVKKPISEAELGIRPFHLSKSHIASWQQRFLPRGWFILELHLLLELKYVWMMHVQTMIYKFLVVNDAVGSSINGLNQLRAINVSIMRIDQRKFIGKKVCRRSHFSPSICPTALISHRSTETHTPHTHAGPRRIQNNLACIVYVILFKE